MGIRVEITEECESEVVAQSLMQSYEWILPDYESEKKLLDALEVVIEYYTTEKQFKDWKRGVLSKAGK